MTKKKEKKFKGSTLIFTLVSVLLGLLVGAIVLALAGYNPIEAYQKIIEGVFKSPRNMGWAIVNSTPIILTGLGVCFAFKTGLFNMGAEGQFIIGTTVGFLLGYGLDLPPVLHVLVTVLLAILAGFIYGGIAGFVKAKFGIHEVISTIMLNWIAFYFQNFIVFRYKMPNSMNSFEVKDSAKITLIQNAAQKYDGFMGQFFRAPIHAGIFFAIICAILIHFILNKTSLGYKLKAVGLNKEASEYGGINVNRKLIQSMAISGAICSLAGVSQILGYTYSLPQLSAMENFGFDGLAVALLASNNPIGCIFSGLFLGSLKYAGGNLQRTMGVPSELISIIIGTIILFTAIPLIFKIIRAKINKKAKRKAGKARD
ncbi:ABC transporter permease [uncultured Anaerococcus sp.]|uniref:ABC transporter permease n=1 Tax=uncultured Anaerococcus sp. TaxID=293428 RepID=UPI002624F3DA|nr:ABC transporter permease [uncultured Anaerococcus sp.]